MARAPSFKKKQSRALLVVFGALPFISTALARPDELVAKTGCTDETLIIGDYRCYFPTTKIFRMDTHRRDADGLMFPIDPQPFEEVCELRKEGGFRCGPNAPFGLANSVWKPVPTKIWACKKENYRPRKFACTKTCSPGIRKNEFFVDAYECDL